MIFLKRLSLRRDVSEKVRGGITVWLALCFLIFAALYQACWQSVRKQCQRQRAEQAAEAGMFSLLSEYEPYLLEKYDLFFLDTSFRTGTEQQEELCSRLWKYIELNLQDSLGRPIYDLDLKGVNIQNLVRATDNNGQIFYQQAIRVMKEKSGVSLLEDWTQLENYRVSALNQAKRFQKDCEHYEGKIVDYKEDELSDEILEWDELRESLTLQMTLPERWEISRKMIFLDTVPSRRELSYGSGNSMEPETGLLDKQWFVRYLCEYMNHAQDVKDKTEEERYLSYQLEYVLEGASSDRENLEQVIKKLLLMREGVNYIFLLTHAEYEKKVDILARVLVGLSGNEGLVQSVKHIILLSWASGESLVEVRQLLNGYELSMIKSESDWQVPLSWLLSLLGNPGRYDTQLARQEGMDYEATLRMLLILLPREELAMRALDVIEGELQLTESGRKIHVDHCVERMTAQIWLDGIYMERNAGYE